jgi:serine/threonine-protein kinase HipA
MKSSISDVKVILYGHKVGTLVEDNGVIYFQYYRAFQDSGLEISPLKLPLKTTQTLYTNSEHPSYMGMPGVFFDSLPDANGMAIMDRYFERQGLDVSSIGLLRRLMFVANRGIGAFEYIPKEHDDTEITNQVILAKDAYEKLKEIKSNQTISSIDEIMSLIDSASPVGGAKPKMMVQYNSNAKEIILNSKELVDGFSRYILKFDTKNKDETKFEYLYMNMAKDCGISIPSIDLLEEGDLCHYIIKRFDRDDNDFKIHISTASALTHRSIQVPRNMSYEELFKITNFITKDQQQIIELFRRMVFNIFSLNNDTHPKNFSFILNSNGKWSLSPAYDVTYSYGIGTLSSLMTINGKSKDFILKDFLDIAKRNMINKQTVLTIIENTKDILSSFCKRAKDTNIDKKNIDGCWLNIKNGL